MKHKNGIALLTGLLFMTTVQAGDWVDVDGSVKDGSGFSLPGATARL